METAEQIVERPHGFRVRPIIILAVGWFAFLIYAYPGILTLDSFGQLQEGRAWEFTDPHPPAMAALWGIVDKLIAGPFGMLVIQSTAFLGGLYLILCRAMPQRRAAVVACVLLLFPPVIAPMAVIWKDCQMAGFLVLGIAAVLDERRSVRIVGLVCFFAATAMRYNAPAATFSLMVLLLSWPRSRGERPGRRERIVRYAMATGAWIAVTLAGFGLNKLLVDHEMHLWQSSMAITDITGTLAKMDHELPDSELRELLAPTSLRVDVNIHQAIRERFRPNDYLQLVVGDKRLWDFPQSGTTPAPREVRDAIDHAWNEIVLTHPRAYLAYRYHAFRYAIGGTRNRVVGRVILHRMQYPSLLAATKIGGGTSTVQSTWEDTNLFFAKRLKLFRPHPYLLLAFVLLVFCRKHRDIFAILTSGILYELALFPFVVTPDFRYSHWMIVCTLVSLIMLVARRAAEPTRALG